MRSAAASEKVQKMPSCQKCCSYFSILTLHVLPGRFVIGSQPAGCSGCRAPEDERGCLQPNASFSRSPSLSYAPAPTRGPLRHVNKLRIHQCATCGWGSHGLARWTLSSPTDSFHNLGVGFLKDEPFWWSAPYGGPTTSAPFLHGWLPVACNTLRLMASIIYL